MIERIYDLLLSNYGQAINIGNPDAITIKQFVGEIIKLAASNQKLIFRDLPIDDPKKRRLDINKAKAILGWNPK